MNSNSKTIYFAQHGLAVDKSSDPERPLSEAGIQQTQSVADQLCISNIPVSRIFHSGKLRAAQTADIVASGLSITTCAANNLSPNDDIHLLIPALQNETLYVGHLPHLDKLCNYLLTGTEDAGILEFKNSGVICLTLNDGQGRLNWYLTPDIVITP